MQGTRVDRLDLCGNIKHVYYRQLAHCLGYGVILYVFFWDLLIFFYHSLLVSQIKLIFIPDLYPFKSCIDGIS